LGPQDRHVASFGIGTVGDRTGWRDDKPAFDCNTVQDAVRPALLDRGFSNLGWTGELEPHYQFTSINANRSWAQREPSLAVAMLRALLRGQRFATTHPDEAATIVACELGCEASHALKALQVSAQLGIFDPDLYWSTPGLQRIFHNLQEDQTAPPGMRFEIERYVLPDYLRKAQADRR
jgi:hypothetical protein